MSRALGAVNRVVDPERATVPVSGRDIRKDPFAFREYVDALVYRDLITNVVFLGTPSSGKTTIAARLAREFKTVWMPEYGREYWERHQINRRLSLEQLVEIAEEHVQREEALLRRANRYLFTDTNAITTFVFSLHYHGSAAPRLVELANLAVSRHDVVFVCDIDIPCDDTWDRSGEVGRHVFQKRVLGDLLARKTPFFSLSGGLESRIDTVRRVLEKHRKYMNMREFISAQE
ncbi:AAA family ATPase [Thermodesulfobacteriota bacterium]